MDITATQGKSKRIHIFWSREMDDIALELLVEQVSHGRKGEINFHKEAYTAVINGLKEKIGFDVDKENINNRMRTWKKEYKALKEILDLDGFGWNSTERRVEASGEVWATLSELKPNLVKMRYRSFLDYDKLQTVIGDDQAFGNQGVICNTVVTKPDPDPIAQGKSRRIHIFWSRDMDDVALELLVEQASRGNKGDNGFQKESYTAVADGLRERIGIEVDKENVANRMKTWKKEYKAMKEILEMSGFGWNSETRRVEASDVAWANLNKLRPDLVKMRSRSCLNYDDLCVVIGDDQVLGYHGSRGNSVVAKPDVILAINPRVDSLPPAIDGKVDSLPAPAIDPKAIEVDDSGSSETGTNTSQTRRMVNSRAAPKSKRQKKKDDVMDKLQATLIYMADTVKEVGQLLSRDMLVVRMETLYSAIQSIPEIDQEFAFSVYDQLSSDERKMAAFLGVVPEARMTWLHRHFGPADQSPTSPNGSIP